MEKFDIVIIGSGQGGNPAARAFAQAGFKTAIIEDKLVGGTCINYGCTPSKTLIASGSMAHNIKRSRDFGIDAGPASVKMNEVVDRKNRLVEKSRNAVKEELEKTQNLRLIMGHARFSNTYQLKISKNNGTEEIISAEKIIIDTGTSNKAPAIEGLKEVSFYDTSSIMDLETVPEHLVIIGGGYNGLEMGQLFLRLGSRVSVLDISERFLPKEDDEISAAIKEMLEKEGMAFYIHAATNRVTANKDGSVDIFFSIHNSQQRISASHLLIAAGRTPNTADLDVQKAGIGLDGQGYVKVNEKLETNVPGIYAIGDVNGGPAFTHVSYDDYRILKTNIIEKGNKSTTNRLVPYCLFTDPELGRVGMNEAQAREKGVPYQTATLKMSAVARARETGQQQGLIKAVVDAASGKILGASVFGEQGGEIMNMIEIAMMGGLGYQQLTEAVFAHPTFGECLNNLFSSLSPGKSG